MYKNLNQIIFTENAAGTLSEILKSKSYSKVAVLLDENTLKHCYPLVKGQLPDHSPIEIKSGEHHKNLDTCTHIWQVLTDKHFDRKSLLINLGGGVIGDMGGFCASTFKRGIDFINIPTTLLSQVDASVGGKLGIDFNGFKNHIGLFNEPENIIIDLNFLGTLPERELRSGFAEVIKHHLIADVEGWSTLRKNSFNSMNWKEIVPHSVRIKQRIVEEDPHEDDLRKALNFGHTIGHAVESYLLNANKSVLHGEAIALGMICEAYLCYKKQLLNQSELLEIKNYILGVFPKISLNDTERQEINGYLIQDKKNKGNTILAALLKGIGQAIWDQPIGREEVLDALLYYNKL